MADQLDINRLSAFDTSGDPVSGAKAYFFATGTTTPLTVYSDEALSVAHPTPLLADSGGVFPAIYYGAATAVKVRVDNASDVTLYTIDPVRRISGDLTGAASITFAPTTAIPLDNVQAAIERVESNSSLNFNVISKTSDYTVVAADKTKLILCTADLTLTLTAAATLGDGFVFNVRASGGDVTIDPNSSETIDGAATFVVGDGNSETFVCNGSNWFSLGNSSRLVTTTETAASVAMEFSSIPSGVNMFELLPDGFSLTGTDDVLIRLGTSAGIVTSGYVSSSSVGGVSTANPTGGFVLVLRSGTLLLTGGLTFRRSVVASNRWVVGGSFLRGADAGSIAGAVTLPGDLTQIQIQGDSGSVPDAGTVTLQYII